MTTAIQANILGDILKERERQDKLHPKFIPSDAIAILGEEYGEVCTAMLDLDGVNLREELVQVAAVAVRWIEHLDKGE